MANEPYTTPETAAPTISKLVGYLSTHDDGTWFYRGQIRCYDKLLLPSAFRAMLRETPVIDVNQPDAGHSMRGIGRRFFGNFVWDREDFEQQAAARLFGSSVDGWRAPPAPAPGTPRDADAYYRTHFSQPGGTYQGPPWTPLDELARSTLSTVEFNGVAERQGCQATVASILAQRFPSVDPNDTFAHAFIDNFHRHVFHTDILVNACGYLVGSLISQHYGFYSSLLDATTSIDVAAFFATHALPDYHLVSYVPAGSLGVIYRFPNLAPNLTPFTVFETDYYHAPGTLQTHTILEALEADVSVEESLKTLRQCFQMRTCPGAGERRYELLKFPRGAVARSRIGRQKAAVVIPDEIIKAVGISVTHPITGLPSFAPNFSQWECQKSIEDLHHRPGVQCFFFRHGTVDPTPQLNAVYLWPNEDDYLLLAIAYLFVSGVCFHAYPAFILPQRLDLIDPGYGQIPTDRLAASARDYLSRCDESALSATSAPLFPGNDKFLFYIYKAGVLSYRGHVTGDGVAIEEALKHCWLARSFDRTSLVLIALEMLLHEAMGRRSELAALNAEAEGVLTKESRTPFWESMGCSSAFEFFQRNYLYPLYQRRFSRNFPYYFYELYQSA